ncbi:MAG: DUF4349 domain-containing protein [Lacrimispora sp.]|uniref:DUF4349 domain-containing protein n=1 Tax=Lacrimispora sp. TaxID=2719234 RepID=UPI0039E6B462
MKKRSLKAISLLLAALLLGGCAGRSGAGPRDVPAEYVRNEGSFSGEAEMADTTGTKAFAAESQTMAEENKPMLPAGRKLIRTVSLNLETDAFDTLISGLEAKVLELGGYIEQSDMGGNSLYSSGDPGPRYASITARIPADHVNGFLTAVESNTNVTNRSESTQDVTLQYSDLESRKKSLEIEQEKMWEFLEKAESVDTVITIQQRLSEIRYQLESMESQLRLYDNQVDYSTVTLYIREVTIFSPTSQDSAGTRIKKGLEDNLRTFKNGAVSFVVILITTIPFWLPVLALAGAVIFLQRRRRKKSSASLPASKEKEEAPKAPES